jgi:hypothetical protein
MYGDCNAYNNTTFHGMHPLSTETLRSKGRRLAPFHAFPRLSVSFYLGARRVDG